MFQHTLQIPGNSMDDRWTSKNETARAVGGSREAWKVRERFAGRFHMLRVEAIRACAATWRRTIALSLGQLMVMSVIEQCRSAVEPERHTPAIAVI
jgi:hypothetical protein